MRWRLGRSVVAGTVIVLFASCDLRRLLFGDEGPLGTSSLEATIRNERVAFADVRPSMYMGFSVFAQTANYYLWMSIGSGTVGVYQWGEFASCSLGFPSGGRLHALPNVGGCTITRSDRIKRVVEGFFSAVVVDAVRQDTIRVEDGVFVLYYPLDD